MAVVTQDLEERIIAVYRRSRVAVLNSRLCVFQNDLHPGPQTLLGSFVEATWSGYTSQIVTTDWGPLIREAAGLYSWQTGRRRFFPPGGVVANTIYGVYLLIGLDLAYSARFAAPILMQAGSDPIYVRLRIREGAQVVLCAN